MKKLLQRRRQNELGLDLIQIVLAIGISLLLVATAVSGTAAIKKNAFQVQLNNKAGGDLCRVSNLRAKLWEVSEEEYSSSSDSMYDRFYANPSNDGLRLYISGGTWTYVAVWVGEEDDEIPYFRSPDPSLVYGEFGTPPSID